MPRCCAGKLGFLNMQTSSGARESVSKIELPPAEAKLRVIVMALSPVLLVAAALAFVEKLPAALSGHAPFAGLYADAAAVRAGHLFGSYDPTRFGCALYEAVLLSPLAWLSYSSAYLVFLGANLALLALSFTMMRPYLDRLARVWKPLPPALYLCFFPATMALVDGTDSLLLMALITASAVSFYREQEWLSGVLLGLALFDPQYAVPIALLFFVWRRWRIAAGFASCAAAWVLLTAWLTGSADPRVVLTSFVHPHLPGSWAFPVPSLHWMFQQMAPALVSFTMARVAALVLSLGLLVWATTRPPNYALASAVALLVGVSGYASDLVLLILPMGFILLSRVAQSSPRELFSKYVMGGMFVVPALLLVTPRAEFVVAALLILLLIPLRSLF
jgi:hypothetical protein